MDIALSLLFGSIAGFALGLTGGGGSIFAVPMLVYGLSVPTHQAVGISLAAVGTTAAFGFAQRIRHGEVEIGTGLLFAVLGMIGAPLGAWLNSLIPEPMLLTAFSGLMVVVAVRMWRKASRTPSEAKVVRAPFQTIPDESSGPICRRDPEGKLRLTSQCASLLAGLGFLTGVLSGLFGVGGGFVIVPVLVLFSGMGIHRAVATSLMVITLISLSGTSWYILSGREIDLSMTASFAGGGILGMFLGTITGRKISGPLLQKGFSIAMIILAVFIVVRSTVLLASQDQILHRNVSWVQHLSEVTS